MTKCRELLISCSALMLILDAGFKKKTPPPPPPPAPAPAPPPAPAAAKSTPAEILARQVQDVHFDYDKSDIRPEEQATLSADATALKTIFSMDPSFVVTIEGHCDERGSAEYNIGLGDRRSAAVRDALVSMGITADKLKTVSYGKERPI